MSENNVPNQEENENAFGNMIIEPELNPFKEVINLNQKNILNINNQNIEKKKYHKNQFYFYQTKKA